jgi:hypothetical protein
METWWFDTNRFSRQARAHILTGENLGCGNIKTACGKSINVEYREKVTPENEHALNIKYCGVCQKTDDKAKGEG